MNIEIGDYVKISRSLVEENIGVVTKIYTSYDDNKKITAIRIRGFNINCGKYSSFYALSLGYDIQIEKDLFEKEILKFINDKL